MKPARLSLLFSILSIFSLPGCGDRSTPTQPAAAIDLAGHWSGTVNSEQGTVGPASVCRSEAICADFTQAGTSVSGRLLASCTGSMDFTGKIEGDGLTGLIAGGSQTFTGGRVIAAASSSRIEMLVGRSSREGFAPVLSIKLLR